MKPPKTSIDSFRTMARADISGSPTGAPQPVVRSPLQCRVFLFAGDVNRSLATGDDTGGAFAQWEVVVPPGGGPRPHVHTLEVESVLVLEGQIELDVGGVLTQAEVGDYVVLPIGVPHAFTNTSREHAVLLFTAAPAGLEQFFFEVGTDVTRSSSLIPLVTGQDAVLCALGSKFSRKPTTLLSGGTKNLVGAMTSAGVRRLVCITGIGAGDSKGHGGFLYDHIIQPLLLSEIYKDKTRQEEIVRASGLDWTIVRPAMLTSGPKVGAIREIRELAGVTAKKISRADVAAYILASLSNVETLRSTVLITN